MFEAFRNYEIQTTDPIEMMTGEVDALENADIQSSRKHALKKNLLALSGKILLAVAIGFGASGGYAVPEAVAMQGGDSMFVELDALTVAKKDTKSEVRGGKKETLKKELSPLSESNETIFKKTTAIFQLMDIPNLERALANCKTLIQIHENYKSGEERPIAKDLNRDALENALQQKIKIERQLLSVQNFVSNPEAYAKIDREKRIVTFEDPTTKVIRNIHL